uniref:Uncharacterized protein n=1 Tax=Aegilops tauschii TaxID=37682 RepID=M8AYJ1_AEGTA
MYIRMQTGIHGVSYTKSYFNTAADRLSALPNDVLARILSFAPTHEAAATALLSRRWRSVWHRTSFLNLDTRPYCTRRLEPFFEDAHDILASLRRRGSRRRRHGAGLKTLKLFLEEGAYYISKSWRREGDDAEPDHRVAELLADPAVARLEELSIGCAKGHTSDDRYFPPLASLPCAVTLRVLELTNCNLEPPSTAPSSGLAFPCLTDLTLRNCFFLEGYLQDVVDATPALTSLALANVRQKAAGSGERLYDWDYFMLPLRLRCPTVTALVLVTFVDEKQFKASAAGCSGIELDMPSLRFFRFQGYPVKLSLTSPAPGLASHSWALSYEPPSRIIANFSSTRALKVRLQSIEDIVADDEDKDGGVILPTFPNLKLLELDGEYWLHKNSKTVVATARLLRSCPVPAQVGQAMRPLGRKRVQGALRRVHGETSLRKVTLRFKFLRKVNCFPTQLAKFLAENALVLEEMHVDDGSQFWPDHLCHKVGMWRAESFRRKNLPATAAGFRVCQLPMDKPAKDPDEESCYGYGYEYD